MNKKDVTYGTKDFQSISYPSWSAGEDCDRSWFGVSCEKVPFRAPLQCNRLRLACWWEGPREGFQQAASQRQTGTLEGRRTRWCVRLHSTRHQYRYSVHNKTGSYLKEVVVYIITLLLSVSNIPWSVTRLCGINL
jgi:hypothetical protein